MIIADNVQFSYGKRKDLFNKLSLRLEKNKIYGLLGRNGVGKSTLMKLMAGFLPAQSGKLQVDSYTPSERKVEFMENIFFLNEDFELPAIRIPNYLLAHAGFYRKFDEGKFYTILKEFEVPVGKNLSSLSFGQKKKVIIAFGLASNVDYIFFDEPTNGLDIPSKAQFRKLMAKSFNEEQSIIISTHQIRDLANLLDNVIIIENGDIRIAQDISAIEQKLLFTNHRIENQTPIYSELLPGGSIYIYPNPDQHDSQIEIETFFNAMLKEADALTKIING